MNKTRMTIVLASGLLGFMCCNAVLAAPFEQAFKLTKINGECSVMTPEGNNFDAAAEGKAYPYGSKIKTGRKSSVILEFSAGNLCRVLASTVLTVTEDAKDKKAKTIKLDEGEVAVELEEKFHENNSLNVETAAAICGAIGCKFSVKSMIESDLKVIKVTCDDGKIKVSGPDYEIPLLEKDDGVTISKASEKDFIRIKNIKGAFLIGLKNSQGEPVTPELKLGYSVKIYREVSPNGANMLVYILILTPEGKTETTYAYSRPLDKPVPGKDETPAGDGKKKKKDGEEAKPGDNAIIPLSTTTTTSTTTTSTTLPPKDAAAVRLHTTTPTGTVPPVVVVGGTTSSGSRPSPTPVGGR